MLRKAKFLVAAIPVFFTATALVGMDARPAHSLEPNAASQIVALSASQSPIGLPCPNDNVAFARIGPEGAEDQSFAVPNGVVFVATAFE